ncbi:27820_t:CDS:2 [Dentiscutata erythropus]|uniref:27820_t:CDS:1 n=1 Tax=Dentiscutata erythropus TaxID=1348616 RepID=A0A9N9F6S0_9GLOM|nr:27820_t:CDS:2 [Dentiscutata erythropus]
MYQLCKDDIIAKKYTKKPQEQSNYKDLVWSDQNIDERASDYFSILLIASKNKDTWKPLGRPLAYIGAYFAPALTYSNIVLASTSTCKSLTELHALMKVESIEVEPIGMESTEMKLIEMRSTEIELTEMGSTADVLEKIDIDKMTKIWLAIEELDRMLKKDNNQMDKGRRNLPKDNCGKFAKVSSLLDDERISMKFSVNPKVLKNYVENEVFPSLELEPILLKYCDKDLLKLLEKDIPPREKRHCVITHDKTTLSANDNEKTG